MRRSIHTRLKIANIYILVKIETITYIHTYIQYILPLLHSLRCYQVVSIYLFSAGACDTLQAFHSLRLQLRRLAVTHTHTHTQKSLQGLITGDKRIVDLFLDNAAGSLDELLLRLQGNPNIRRGDIIHTITTASRLGYPSWKEKRLILSHRCEWCAIPRKRVQ